MIGARATDVQAKHWLMVDLVLINEVNDEIASSRFCDDDRSLSEPMQGDMVEDVRLSRRQISHAGCLREQCQFTAFEYVV